MAVLNSIDQLERRELKRTDEECVRHVGELLRVRVRESDWRGDRVGDDVVHEGSPRGARVAQPHHLHNINNQSVNHRDIHYTDGNNMSSLVVS